MSDRDKFRVWCENKNEYETHEVVADQDGRLYHHARMSQTLRKDTHIREQCTGLKDKNGTLIFEGDILRGDETAELTLNYYDSSDGPVPKINALVVEMRPPRYWLRDERFGYEGEQLIEPSECTIIGNVHLNPELLEA